jgi:hypothetical protein
MHNWGSESSSMDAIHKWGKSPVLEPNHNSDNRRTTLDPTNNWDNKSSSLNPVLNQSESWYLVSHHHSTYTCSLLLSCQDFLASFSNRNLLYVCMLYTQLIL